MVTHRGSDGTGVYMNVLRVEVKTIGISTSKGDPMGGKKKRRKDAVGKTPKTAGASQRSEGRDGGEEYFRTSQVSVKMTRFP